MSKKLAALLMSAFLSVGTQAATETWNMRSTGSGGEGSFDYTGYGNTLTINKADNSLKVTGWSDTAYANGSTGGVGDDYLQTTKLERWSGGLGSTNQHPNDSHTIDNFSGGDDTDMVLLSFEKAVSLTEVNIGYTTGVADVTVVGYTGSGTPDPSDMAGKTWSQVQGSPSVWQTVSELLSVSVGAYAVNAAGITSKYWLIGACNSVFNSATCIDGKCDHGGGFKLATVTGTTPNGGGGGEVPAPASVLLILAGLLAMQRSSKKKLAA